MEGQVRDANWRLQQLQTQYDFLASKTSSQGTAFKDAEERLEVVGCFILCYVIDIDIVLLLLLLLLLFVICYCYYYCCYY